MPNRFCAICGKGIDENDPHFGLCYNCYLKENPLFELPDVFSFNICLDCGNYSKKEDWIKPENIELLATIVEALNRYLLRSYIKKDKIDFQILFDEKTFEFSSKDLLKRLNAIVKGTLKENNKIKYEQIINIKISYTLCKNCANIRGGTHFISIIQLRVKDDSQFDLIQEVLDYINQNIENLFEKDPKQYISKIENQKYGVDLYLSTNELINYIIKSLRMKYHFLLKRSKKLVGRDIQRGKNIYRLKALIKFLPIEKNDIIIINNKDFRVENIIKNKIFLRNENNTRLIKDFNYIFNENVIKKKGEKGIDTK